MTAWSWTRQRERAAALAADDALTDEQIAGRLSVSAATLARWKRAPEFACRVAQHVEAFRAAVTGQGVADKVKRIRALQLRWERLHQVIEERAQAAQPGDAPGAGTGLLVKQVRQLGHGAGSRLVEEWTVDAGLLRELREVEKQAAIELWQWTERRDVTSAGQPVKALIGVDVDAV